MSTFVKLFYAEIGFLFLYFEYIFYNLLYNPVFFKKSTILAALSDKIKRDFFKAVSVYILPYGCTKWMLTKHTRKNLVGTTHECCVLS